MPIDKKKRNKYNIVYQTKNLVNGKTYIGVHCTNKLNDGYIGCGVTSQKNAEYRKVRNNDKSPFVRAVAKYGYENFKVEILNFFDTEEEAYGEEAWIVDENWVKREDNYNVALGGLMGHRQPFYDEYPKELIEDYLKGVNLETLILKYKVSYRCAKRAVKGLRYTEEYYLTSNLQKFKTVLPEIKLLYESGYSRTSLQKKYKMPYAVLKMFITHFNWVEKVDIYVAVKGDIVEEFSNIKAFCVKNNIFHAGIYLVLKGKISHYKGWRFYKKGDYESGNYEVKQPKNNKHQGLKFINPQGEIEMVTTNLTDFCKSRGLQPSSIHQIWSGRMKQHKGYKLWQETN